MKKLLLPFFALVILAGCEKLEGQLNISKDVKLVNSDGVTRLLKIGTYTADVKPNTSKKITLRLNNDNDEKYIFKLPGGTPANGKFSYASKDVGQPVDVSGVVATTATNSERREISQSCTYTETYNVCHHTPTGPVCTIESRTVYGRQYVTYYDRTTLKDVTLNIKTPKTTDVVAEFQGDASWIERIIVRETPCR